MLETGKLGYLARYENYVVYIKLVHEMFFNRRFMMRQYM